MAWLHVGEQTVMFFRGRIASDIQGADRSAMQVRDALAVFKCDRGEKVADDGLLLG